MTTAKGLTTRPILRDDTGRLVRIHQVIESQHKVVLERMDRASREHQFITRHKAEVDHYPLVRPNAHTNGPWKAHLNAPTAVIPGHLIKTDDDIGHPVAVLWQGGGTEGKPRQIANAHLIAAAPELLENLSNLVSWAENMGHFSAKDPVFLATIRESKVAIAKAQGNGA
jgi:hypothetical protein